MRLAAFPKPVYIYCMTVPLALHVLYHNCTYTEGVCRLIWTLDLLILLFILPHHLMHLLANISKDVVQEFDCTPSGAHTLHHAKIDMLAFLRDFLVNTAHEFKNLEKLCYMHVLLR